MKKKIYIFVICLCTLFASGCSNDNLSNDATHENVTESEITDNNADTTIEDTTLEQEENLPEPVEPTNVQLSMEEPFNNTRIMVAYKGLAQYEQLIGEDYTDTPEEGNVFVVVYLNIENYSNSDTYFSAESLQAKVDNTEISHTFLVNDPEGYPTIFKNIPAVSGINGYIVWEVPKNWSEISFEYSGWKDSFAVILNGKLTPADLSEPIPFDQL